MYKQKNGFIIATETINRKTHTINPTNNKQITLFINSSIYACHFISKNKKTKTGLVSYKQLKTSSNTQRTQQTKKQQHQSMRNKTETGLTLTGNVWHFISYTQHTLETKTTVGQTNGSDLLDWFSKNKQTNKKQPPWSTERGRTA